MANFDQNMVFGQGVQGTAAQNALSISYIWIETVCYAVCGVLIFLFTVEKNLKEEQAAIAARKKGK